VGEDIAQRFFTEDVEDALDIVVVRHVHDLRENAARRERRIVAGLPPDVLRAHLVKNQHAAFISSSHRLLVPATFQNLSLIELRGSPRLAPCSAPVHEIAMRRLKRLYLPCELPALEFRHIRNVREVGKALHRGLFLALC